MELPKTICMLPWTSIETSPIGSARPCCMAYEEITDATGEKYDLNKHTLSEIYNSEYMQKLRQQFRAGEKPATCNRCWEEEAAGRSSKRIHTHTRLKEWLPEVDWQNDTPDQLWFIDLKLGNICNLACRICGSWSSSTWGTEELAYMPRDFDKKTHLAYTFLKQGQWPRKSTVFWDNLKTLLPHIRYFEFTGGEPWMIPEHWEFLTYAVQSGESSHIDIHYNTNATQMPTIPQVELFKDFGRVDIAFSIDNVGDRFEYERYGAKWDRANDIIDTIHHRQKHYANNITTQLCFTINIQNVYYLDELIAWAETKGFGDIYFNMMHSPNHMSVQYMTPEANELVLNKLKTTFWSNNHYQREYDALIKFIEAGPGSDGGEFLFKMKQTDEYRKQNFTNTHPEIARAMGYE